MQRHWDMMGSLAITFLTNYFAGLVGL